MLFLGLLFGFPVDLSLLIHPFKQQGLVIRKAARLIIGQLLHTLEQQLLSLARLLVEDFLSQPVLRAAAGWHEWSLS
jgi:hypothetical protein